MRTVLQLVLTTTSKPGHSSGRAFSFQVPGMKLFTICFTILLLGGQIIAQQNNKLIDGNFPPPQIPVSLYAIEAGEPITIDGKLKEHIWEKARIVEDFFRMEPRQGGEYFYKTTVRVLYDKKFLYIGAFCRDTMGKNGLRVQDFRRDFLFGSNDEFFVSLDPQNTKRFCVSFHVSPLGTQRDAQVFDDVVTDNDWDAVWKTRTNTTDSGYIVEIAIPFSSLRYNKIGSDTTSIWGVTFSRLVMRNYEQTVFPAIPQAFSPYRMTYAAQLKGLKLPPPSLNLRVNPYSILQHNTSSVNGLTIKETKIKFGGELKWAVTPNAVLDATFNTDFAQADVDRAVNNLTRFNVFFPEKRQFFLENNGIYAGAGFDNIKPFFSRSIGLANTQFNADPVPIDAGVRYTDRTQKRTIAGLYVHQKGTATQGAGNFAVLRFLKNFGSQNNVGVMLTQRLDERDENKGIEQYTNATLNIDGLWRPRDALTIQYLLSGSRNNTSDSLGFAASIYASWSPNKAYLYYQADMVSEKYVPGMGYVFAGNTIKNSTGGYFIWRPKNKAGKFIRRWDPGAYFTSYHNVSDGRFQSAEIDLFPVWIYFRNNNTFFVDAFFTWEEYFFEPLGIKVAPGRYIYTSVFPRFATDDSKKISGSVGVQYGSYYNGMKTEATVSVRIAPVPHITFTGEYKLVNIQDLGLQNENLKFGVTTVGARLATNPRLQASIFYQYNAINNQGRWNVRGSWEFAPLNFVYVVFNDNNYRFAGNRDRSFINKISYIRQF